MGYFAHHALIVTAPVYELDGMESMELRELHEKAKRLLQKYSYEGDYYDRFLTPIVRGCNDYESFAILPDGSKEGWEMSDSIHKVRMKIADEIRNRIEDPNEPDFFVDYALVRFGDDCHHAEFESSDELRSCKCGGKTTNAS